MNDMNDKNRESWLRAIAIGYVTHGDEAFENAEEIRNMIVKEIKETADSEDGLGWYLVRNAMSADKVGVIGLLLEAGLEMKDYSYATEALGRHPSASEAFIRYYKLLDEMTNE